MIKTKTVINPFTRQLQQIPDDETIAEKDHNHKINEIIGLNIILNYLLQDSNVQVNGGYFAQ